MSLDCENTAALQENDPAFQVYCTAITGLRFVEIPVPGSNRTVLSNVSQLTPCPIVPDSLFRLVFDTVHNVAHPVVNSTQQIITQHFVWQRIKKNISSWVCSCPACQLAKIHRLTIAPLDQFVLQKGRFDCIDGDIVSPLPPSRGHKPLHHH